MSTLSHSRPPLTRDHEDFRALYESHAAPVFAYCRRRTYDRESAEDACAMVFLEAWRRRSEVDLLGRPAAPWLYGVARNVLYNQRRSHQRRALALSSLRHIEPTESEDVSACVERRQLMDDMLDLLRMLPPAQRVVVCLCALHESSYEATAAALDIPVGTVRSRLSRARNQLALGLRVADAGAGASPVEAADRGMAHRELRLGAYTSSSSQRRARRQKQLCGR